MVSLCNTPFSNLRLGPWYENGGGQAKTLLMVHTMEERREHDAQKNSGCSLCIRRKGKKHLGSFGGILSIVSQPHLYGSQEKNRIIASMNGCLFQGGSSLIQPFDDSIQFILA